MERINVANQGWFLPLDAVNELQARSIDRIIQRAKHAHMTDVDMRINGQNEHHEADWIKHMRRTGGRMTTLDPNRVQICRVAPINYDNGQPCACPDGTCSLWKAGLRPRCAR